MKFQEQFQKKLIPEVMKELGITNPMRAPRIEKVVVSSSLKEAVQDVKVLDRAADEIAQITGQKPVITRAKKSIAAFKLRKGIPIGCKVTLRRRRMYEFLNRLINIALPRVRDFKGVPDRGFDGRGNYTLGITEQIVFSEIQFDKVDKVRGMNVTIVTTAHDDQEAKVLLKAIGMPFSAKGGSASG
ncbi:MAG: 50S ribosomal protein L5 [Deltaproteobacteria bacterium]|nr:50S ribosomal protein L5 [Deltaproteobacteria bacterium]